MPITFSNPVYVPPKIIDADSGRKHKMVIKDKINPLDIPSIEEYLEYLKSGCEPVLENDDLIK